MHCIQPFILTLDWADLLQAMIISLQNKQIVGVFASNTAQQAALTSTICSILLILNEQMQLQEEPKINVPRKLTNVFASSGIAVPSRVEIFSTSSNPPLLAIPDRMEGILNCLVLHLCHSYQC